MFTEIKYNIVMRANRRYSVRMRVKIRKLIFKRSRLFMGLALAAGLAVYGGAKSYRTVSGFSFASFFSFRLKELRLNCPAPAVNEHARGLFLARQGKTLSSQDCSALALEIKKRNPEVREVSVRRNFLEGSAVVTVRLEPVVAQVFLEGGTTAYLSEGGKVLAESFLRPSRSGLRTEIYGRKEDLSLPAFAGFLNDFSTLQKNFLSRPRLLEYRPRENTCRVFLENGCEVLWGEFEFTRAKILRLNEILKDVSSKLKLPVSVDLRLFREGRIFISRPAGGRI